MMIPTQLGLLGFYELNKSLKLLNTFIPLIIPAAASPFTVFFMRQYLKSTLHPGLIDAARIDGAGELKIFHKIVLPLMMPAIATMSIFAFIGSWNNYLMPLIIIFSPEKYTLPVLMGYLKRWESCRKSRIYIFGYCHFSCSDYDSFHFLVKAYNRQYFRRWNQGIGGNHVYI